MSVSLTAFALFCAAYVLVVLLVGVAARRRSSSSAEEYFLAGRGLGPLVLFMALFGTNCTAFVLVGIPGIAYRKGVGVFGLNAALVALGVPLTFYLLGVPARRMARRLGALTPAELYSLRFGRDTRAGRWVGYLLFAVFTLYTLPYMATAVDGAALTLELVTGGAVPRALGAVGVLGIALLYTTMGGMRATAWTNVLQGALFLGFMVALLFLVPARHGGLAALMEEVRRVTPEALSVDASDPFYAPGTWFSWGLAISLTVIAFPHMLVRIVAAESERGLKAICRLYPLALVALWLPAVLLGVWGAALHPGLAKADSDGIFARMVTSELSPTLAAVGFLAVLAAVMSTLDAQILTLGSMLTRDVLDVVRPGAARAGDVRSGRWFGVAVALLVFAYWALLGRSIFGTGAVAFSGYTTLVPVLFLGVRWRRLTAAGAIASILLGNAVYALCLWLGGGLDAALKPTWAGLLPVFWALLASIVGAVLVSLATSPQPRAQLDRAFSESAS